jgi:hypothetical protein
MCKITTAPAINTVPQSPLKGQQHAASYYTIHQKLSFVLNHFCLMYRSDVVHIFLVLDNSIIQ